MSQTKTMSSSKKMTIAVICLAVALFLALGAMIGVFAAGNQTVGSNFKVSYTATNVAATVSAKYQLNDADDQPTGNATEMNSVSFTAAEESTTKNVDNASQINLALATPSVTFTYTFKNNSTSVPFTVTLTDGALKDNVSVTYKAGKYTTTGSGEDLEWVEPASYAALVDNQITVGASEQWAIQITVKITDTNSAAKYVSDSSNFLSWALNSTVNA